MNSLANIHARKTDALTGRDSLPGFERDALKRQPAAPIAFERLRR